MYHHLVKKAILFEFFYSMSSKRILTVSKSKPDVVGLQEGHVPGVVGQLK